MTKIEQQLREAQNLMRSGYWDAADDLLEQMLSKLLHLENQVDELKAQVKQQKMTIKQMDRRIMANDR
jgi:phage shock protein A